MNQRNREDRNRRIAFSFIRVMHDNILLRILIDPAKLLQALGVKRGDRVLEVGCGPGFYTLGAAEAIGPEGEVYAFDINPYAVAYVKKKLNTLKIQNVQAIAKSATQTGLPASSVDFAFVTGVPHLFGGRSSLLDEMARVLTHGGTLAYRPSRGGHDALLDAARSLGMRYSNTQKRFLIFKKVA